MNSTMKDKTNKLIRPPPVYTAFEYALLTTDQGTEASFLCLGGEAKPVVLKTSVLKKPSVKSNVRDNTGNARGSL